MPLCCKPSAAGIAVRSAQNISEPNPFVPRAAFIHATPFAYPKRHMLRCGEASRAGACVCDSKCARA